MWLLEVIHKPCGQFFKDIFPLSPTPLCGLYWRLRLYQNQKPNVEICCLALVFYNEKFFEKKKNQKWGSTKHFKIWQLLWIFEVFGKFLVTRYLYFYRVIRSKRWFLDLTVLSQKWLLGYKLVVFFINFDLLIFVIMH